MRADRPTIVIIAAVAENGVIGQDGAIPWHVPGELAHFKETTMGHPVIMGRRTFESILAQLGGPLPGRTNIVLTTSDPDVPDEVVLATSIPDAIDRAADVGETAFIAGGATVYAAMLPLADRMIISEIAASPTGDVTFPDWDPNAWCVLDRDAREGFTVVTYERS